MTEAENATTSPEKLLGWLTGKFVEWAEIEAAEFDPAQPLTRYGLDSFGAMTFATELEDELDLQIPPNMLWDNPTLESFAKALFEEIGKSRGG